MFNVIHAEADLVSRVMAAMPSLFLLLAFETFLGQIKYGVVWSQVAQNLQHLLTRTQAVQTEIEQQQAEVEQLTAQIDDLKATEAKMRSELAKLEVQARSATAFNKVTLTHANAARQTNKQQALNDLLAFYSEHPTASMNEAGQAIGRAKSTVSNYLNELEQIGRLRRNGDGVEVLD